MASTDEFFRDQPFEEEGIGEDSSDLRLSISDFKDLFVVPSDYTVKTLRSELKGLVDLDPDFQRRSVWSIRAKSLFIESLILGVPIPQILLAEGKAGGSRYLVLDGKQRLLTILEFFAAQFSDGKPFKLSGLENLSALNGLTWNEISTDREFASAIDRATIRTAIIRGWTNDSVLYEIFYRLNSGSVKLSPMELRMALHRGDFLKFAIRWTEKPNLLHQLLRLKEADRRMSDVELVVRHLAFVEGRSTYRGNLKEFLDQYCQSANLDFAEAHFQELLDNMITAIDAGFQIFARDQFCRKYISGEERFDRRFNRAVFDVVIYSLTNKRFRAWAIEHSGEVVNAFIEVCGDQKFVDAVESTTKSIKATNDRFSIWLNKAHSISNVNIAPPRIANDSSN